MLQWTFGSQLPLSHDGSTAIYCDKNGNPTPNGKFIKWYILTADGIPVMQLARIIYPKKPLEILDYAKMRQEVKENKKYNTKSAKAANNMRARLMRIFGKMGVSHMDALNITKPNGEIDTACWGQTDREEFIFINPYILMNKVSFATFMLKHEILHRALYRGRDNLSDKKLLNIVLDICVNRVLAESTSGKLSSAWLQFCSWVYPQESKKTILALCNASLSTADLSVLRTINPNYAKIWEEIYGVEARDVKVITKSGKEKVKKLTDRISSRIANMSPDDLYFRLKNELTEKDKSAIEPNASGGLNPFGESKEEITPHGMSKAELKSDAMPVGTEKSVRMEKAMRRSLLPKRLQRSISWKQYSDHRTEFWDRFVKTPEDIKDPELEKYCKKITTQKILDNISGKILETLQEETVIKCYPEHLTENGMFNAAIGLRGKRWPFYENMSGTEGRKRIVVFFDLSPSMMYFFPHIMYMCDTFEDQMDLVFARNNFGESGVFAFAGSVKELNREEVNDMRHGKLSSGASTSFNSLVEYCVEQINTNDVDAVVCFTDGESGLDPYWIKQFNNSGKKMYRVYMSEDRKDIVRDIKSDLDLLNGTSFNLRVPRTDKV